ncbi:hypothetical protein [Methanopyrus kandleri]
MAFLRHILLASLACLTLPIAATCVNEEFESKVESLIQNPDFQGTKEITLYSSGSYVMTGRIKVSYRGPKEVEPVEVGKLINGLKELREDLDPLAGQNEPIKDLLDALKKFDDTSDVLEKLKEKTQGLKLAACEIDVDLWYVGETGTLPSDLPQILQQLRTEGELHLSYKIPYPEAHVYVVGSVELLDRALNLPIRAVFSYDYPNDGSGVKVSVDTEHRKFTIETTDSIYNLIVVEIAFRGGLQEIEKLADLSVESSEDLQKLLENTEVKAECYPRGGRTAEINGLPLMVDEGAAIVVYAVGSNPINSIVASKIAELMGKNPLVVTLGNADLQVGTDGKTLVIKGSAPGGLVVIYGPAGPDNTLDVTSRVGTLQVARALGAQVPPLVSLFGWILGPLLGSITATYTSAFSGELRMSSRGIGMATPAVIAALLLGVHGRRRSK